MSDSPQADAPPSLEHPAKLRFEADALPWQRSLRWGRPARDRRVLLLGFLLALLVTLLEVVGFVSGMRPYRLPPRADVAIQVDLIEPEAESPPPPPEPEPPEFVRRPSRIPIEPPKVRTPPPPPKPAQPSDAMSARIGSAGSEAPPEAPPPQLFNPDGSVRLGAAAGPGVAPPSKPQNPQEAAKARWAEIERRGNPLDCHKTRFAQVYEGDQSAGDKIAGKYLKWIGLADPQVIAHNRQKRAESGGCEPAR